MHEALVAHANTNSRIAILHDVENASITEVKATALALQGGNNAENAALYYPWVQVPTTINGVTRFIPPVGYVAAKRATAHNQTGSHVPAAGLLSASRFVAGVKTDIDKTNGDSLDDAGVNAIRIIQNSVRIYGARSLSADDENFRYITAQDTVNHVVIEAGRSLEDLVFSTIDGRNTIFSAIESRLIAILSPLRDIGALFESYDANGRKIDSGFTVRCDAKLNPVSQLAGGTVKAKVGLRVSSVGDKIEVDIIKSNLTASVV
jgi:phage tail sheath protein FI